MGRVLIAAEDQIAVDFVGDDVHVVTQTGLRHRLELGAGEDAAHGIVRIAQQKRARAIRDGGLEPIQIHRVPAVRLARQLHLLPFGAGPLCRAKERWVDRRLDQETVAGSDQRVACLVVADDDAGGEHERLRRNAPVVQLHQALDEHLSKLLRRAQGVAEHPLVDILAQRACHRLRRGEVHVCHPERQDILRVVGPLGAVGMPTVYDAIEVMGHRVSDVPFVWNGRIGRISKSANRMAHCQAVAVARPPRRSVSAAKRAATAGASASNSAMVRRTVSQPPAASR